MVKSDLPALPSPGSRELKNPKYEKYCRLRASLQPRVQAYREVGWETSDDDDAYSNACQLERRLAIRERIAFHSHQAEQQIAEKRQRIEEALWNIHDADGSVSRCRATHSLGACRILEPRNDRHFSLARAASKTRQVGASQLLVWPACGRWTGLRHQLGG